jgi:uncharacterized protein (DUF1800 family)
MQHLLRSLGGLWISLWLLPLPAQVYTDYLGAGHAQGITVTTSSQVGAASGQVTVDGTGLQPDYYAASRLLAQASFGANQETIEAVAAQGYEAWLDAQFGAPRGSFLDTTVMIWEHFKQAYFDQWGQGLVEGNPAVQPFYFYFRMGWWHTVLTAQDPLRQRVALALSEIMVISEKSELSNSAFAMASYYDVLYRHAFGNFRDLLYDVTMHPAMGFYLDHINNPKSDLANNIHPDENYAREVMQLFTLGLYQLHPDGTRQQDANGEDLPSYDSEDVAEFAKIFTGLGPSQYYWPWIDFSGVPVSWGNNNNYSPATVNGTLPMRMFNAWHEPGPKYLLNGQVVPAGQTGMRDLNAAIDNLFNHPNVGPFIGRLLIQRLVKSNPSPAYISRVAAAFADNGQGVRGDMQAMIKAILLDPEARDCSWIEDPSAGKLREPLVRALQLFEAFDLSNASQRYYNIGFSLETFIAQHPLASPSVFNFFLPDHQPNGPIADADLVAPEFQIHNSRTAVDYFNYMYFSLLDDFYTEVITEASPVNFALPKFGPPDAANQTFLDLSDELAFDDDYQAIVDRLDLIMTGGSLSARDKRLLIDHALAPFAADPNIALRVALYLLVLSPNYNIQK